MKADLIKKAALDSAPAFFGYVPLGVAFGIISLKATGNLWFGPAMSLLVYAGAAQYMSLSIIAAQGSLADLAFMTFVVNLRHIFYGIPFLDTFVGSFKWQFYLIFSITDETYSILTTSKNGKNPTYCLWVSALTHSYWVIGTLVGSIIGHYFSSIDFSALDFSLTALFIILTIEQLYKIKESQPFIIALMSFFISLWSPDEYFLTICMSLCVALALISFKYKEKPYASF